MKFLILILYFYSCLSGIVAQIPANKGCNYSLTGKVLDEHDKSPLEYANVLIVELNKGATTDDKGYFTIGNICSGIYTIKVFHLSCEPISSILEIKKNTVKNFYPEHHTELLKAVSVIAEKRDEQSALPKITLAQEELAQARGQSLGEALKQISGVNSLNTGNTISKPVIHGMHSNRVLILNNGVRLEGQQWGVEHAPEVDTYVSDNLAVVKGANSVRYGSDAIGGVVLLESKPLRDSAGMEGELHLNGMSNGRAGIVSARLEGNFDKLKSLSWRVQGTLKQSGNNSTANYILVNTGMKERNFSYNLVWKKKSLGAEIFYSQFNTSLGIFAASHIGNLSDLQRAFESKVPLETGPFTYEIGRPYQSVEHEVFKIKTYLFTGSKGQLSLTYSRQYNLRNEFDKHGPINDSINDKPEPQLHLELTSHTADLLWQHHTIKGISGSIGLSGITQGNTYEGRMMIPNFSSNGAGLFLIERYRKNRLEVESGIRYDIKTLQIYKYELTSNNLYQLSTPKHDFQNLSGNIGAIFRKDSLLNFSLNAGTAWRAPNVNELYSNGLHHGAAAIEFGNNKLVSERTYNLIFNAQYELSDKLNAEISPYVHYITDFIYRKPGNEPVLTIQGAFPSFYYKQTDAFLRGIDVSLKYKIITRTDLNIKASFLRARNVTEDKWLIMMPSDRFETELKYRFKEKSNLKDSYLSASIIYVTKQWRVPAMEDFISPPSAYYLINAHVSANIKAGNNKINMSLSIYNLLNQSYRDYLDRFRYFSDGMGRNVVFRLRIPLQLFTK